jgi:mannan endo-1,4-beta-mannosidase
MKTLLTSFVLLLFLSIFSSAASAAPQPANFITRRGKHLFDGETLFRSGGTNMYWLGLDENVPPGTIAYPTHFRIRDAFLTAKGLGYSVVRAHTLGISTGNSLSFEPSFNVFNPDALDAADYAISVAAELGIRLVIPLTDNYRYFHGGYWNFCQFGGQQTANASECEQQFYYNQTLIQYFQQYVKERLTHVNKYTHRPTFAETTIMAWETGNELQPPAQWTKTMAAFIKSIAPNHLVLSGRYGVSQEELSIAEVDMYSNHFYPPNTTVLENDLQITTLANKNYFVGEFGWTYNFTDSSNLPNFLNTVFKGESSSAALFWSTFPHNDDPNHNYGYVNHNDGFTMHYYPGDFPLMKQRLELLQDFTWTMRTNGTVTNRCQKVFNYFNTSFSFSSPAPFLQVHSVTNNVTCLTWRGSAGATYYNIYRSCNPGSASLIGNATDFYDLPWCDTSLNNNKQYSCQYQIQAFSEICGQTFAGGTSNTV